jgi:hypothetical protein
MCFVNDLLVLLTLYMIDQLIANVLGLKSCPTEIATILHAKSHGYAIVIVVVRTLLHL